MDERTKAALASATDLSKQLITLATGLLAVELVFLKDFVKVPDKVAIWLLETSWVLLVLSIVFGVQTLMAITGACAKSSLLDASVLYTRPVRVPSAIQILTFLAAIVCSLTFSMRAI